MASVIGNPTPDAPEVTPVLPRPAAPGLRLEEVFFLDPETFLGPVRKALRAHLVLSHASADIAFPLRRKGRKPAPAPEP